MNGLSTLLRAILALMIVLYALYLITDVKEHIFRKEVAPYVMDQSTESHQ